MKLTIIGCGYSGKELARRCVRAGHEVTGTTTREEGLASIRATGASAVVVSVHDFDALQSALTAAEACVWLAPPGKDDPQTTARRVREALGPKGRIVYGSTTGVFGEVSGWVDEETAPGTIGPLGRARTSWERAFESAGGPLSIVRIAGIYGPGRTLRAGIVSGSLLSIDGAPPTSRIHVSDLARLLEACATTERPPSLIVATDAEPAPTLEVARFTASLLGVELPPPISLHEARSRLSPEALELRLGGRKCRSRVREQLIGDLEFPTYREGVRQSLRDEGLI